MRSVVMRSIGAVVVSALCAGCYNYSPIDLASARPGMEVRARVSAPYAAQLAPSLALPEGRLVDGSVVDSRSDALTLKVTSVLPGTAGAPDGLYQQLQIGRNDLVELESKQLDRGRTRLAVGASIATAIVAGVIIVRSGKSSGDNAIVEPPANFSIGPLRLQFGGPRARPRIVPRRP